MTDTYHELLDRVVDAVGEALHVDTGVIPEARMSDARVAARRVLTPEFDRLRAAIGSARNEVHNALNQVRDLPIAPVCEVEGQVLHIRGRMEDIEARLKEGLEGPSDPTRGAS